MALATSSVKEVVTRLKPEGWNDGVAAVDRFDNSLKKTATTHANFSQKITALATTFTAVVAAVRMASDAVMTIANFARQAAGILEPFSTVVGSTTEQIALFYSMSQASGFQLTVEQLQAIRGEYNKISLTLSETNEITRLATLAQKELRVGAEQLTAQWTRAVATGKITNEMLAEIGNISQSDKQKFKDMGSETERLEFLMTKLNERFGEGQVELGSLDDLMSAVENSFKTAAQAGVYELTRSFLGGDDSLNNVMSTIQDTARATISVIVGIGGAFKVVVDKIVNLVETVGSIYNNYLRPLVWWIKNNVPGVGDIVESITQYMPTLWGLDLMGDMFQGYTDAVDNFNESYTRAIDNIQNSRSIGNGGSGAGGTGGGRQNNEDMMIFTEEELIDQERQLAAVWQQLKEYQQQQLATQIEIQNQRLQLETEAVFSQQAKAKQRLVEQGETNIKNLEQFGITGEGWMNTALESMFGQGSYEQYTSGAKQITNDVYALGGALMSLDDVGGQALSSFSSAFATTINLAVSGQKSWGNAMADMAQSLLSSIGQMALTKAMYYTAEALVALWTPGMQGQAAGYATAAAMYAAIATVGIGGGALIGYARGGSGSGGTTSSTTSTFSSSKTSPTSVVQQASTTPESYVFNISYNGPSFNTQREMDEFIETSRKRYKRIKGSSN